MIFDRFPVPNGEQRSISNPWLQFQKMHDERLIFNVCNVTMETILDPTSNEELYNLKFDQLTGDTVWVWLVGVVSGCG